MPTFENFIEGQTPIVIADADEFTLRDASASTVNRLTFAGLKTELNSQYAALVTSISIPGSDMIARTTATGAVTSPTVLNFATLGLSMADAASGDQGVMGPSFPIPSHWATATVSLVVSASAAATGNFRLRAMMAQTPTDGTGFYGNATVWEKTVTPTADAGGSPTVFTVTDATTFTVIANRLWMATPRFMCSHVDNTNTGALRIHEVILTKAS